MMKGVLCPYFSGIGFSFAYGEGAINVDNRVLIAHHQSEGMQAILTAVLPAFRYSAFRIDEYSVCQFQEKPDGDNAWINGDFLLLESSVFDIIERDGCSWEADVLNRRAALDRLSVNRDKLLWNLMLTLRDQQKREELQGSGQSLLKLS